MIPYGQIINESIERTGLILFKPFRFKKWLLLTFVALMAGYLSVGSGGGSNYGTAKKAHAQETSADTTGQSQDFSKPAGLGHDPAKLRLFLLIGVPAILVLIVLFSWLNARFVFIFIDNLVNDRARIRGLFAKFKTIGNSFFLFNLGLSAMIVVVLSVPVGLGWLALKNAGVFADPAAAGFKKIFFICLPYGLCLFGLLLIAGVLGFILRELASVVMFKDALRVPAALRKTLEILRGYVKELAKCLLLYVALSICCAVLGFLVSILALFVLLLPAIVLGVAALFLYKAAPVALHGSLAVTGLVILVPPLLAIFYCLICLRLPFAVFMRLFTLKWFGVLFPQYDLFVLPRENHLTIKGFGI